MLHTTDRCHGLGLLIIAGHSPQEEGEIDFVVEVGRGGGVGDDRDPQRCEEVGHGHGGAAGQTADDADHLVWIHADTEAALTGGQDGGWRQPHRSLTKLAGKALGEVIEEVGLF